MQCHFWSGVRSGRCPVWPNALPPFKAMTAVPLLSGGRYCGSTLLSLMPWAVAIPSVQAALLLGATWLVLPRICLEQHQTSWKRLAFSMTKAVCEGRLLWLLVKKRLNRWQHQMSFMSAVNDVTVIFLWPISGLLLLNGQWEGNWENKPPDWHLLCRENR